MKPCLSDQDSELVLMLVLQLLNFFFIAEDQRLILASNDPISVIDVGHLCILSIQLFCVIDDKRGKIALLQSFENSSLLIRVKATSVDM